LLSGEKPAAHLHYSLLPQIALSAQCAHWAPLRLRCKFDLAKSKIWNLIYQRERQGDGTRFHSCFLAPHLCPRGYMGELAREARLRGRRHGL